MTFLKKKNSHLRKAIFQIFRTNTENHKTKIGGRTRVLLSLLTLRWELENDSWQPRHLTGNGQSDSLYKSQLTLSRGVWWRESCCWWTWWMRTNQADHRSMWQPFWVLRKPCLELSLNRPKCPPKRERGVVLTIHHSCDGGEDKDIQHGHIIGPSWVSHLPAVCLFLHRTEFTKHAEFNIIIFVTREDE